MKSLREVGLGLSVVFGCLFLALVAELYYLLWWKKKKSSSVNVINTLNRDDVELGFSFFNTTNDSDSSFCCKKKKLPFSFRSEAFCSSDTQAVHEPQQQQNNKSFGGGDEETVESELFRLENFPGPPRYLFTIKEETKEDLESETEDAAKSRKGTSSSSSLSDFFHVLESDTPPYLTPIDSPAKYFTPPLTPIKSSPHGGVGIGGLLFDDSSSEAEFNFLVRSSPPPKFQFLKDAEDKLYRNTSNKLLLVKKDVEATSSSKILLPLDVVGS